MNTNGQVPLKAQVHKPKKLFFNFSWNSPITLGL